jgi:NADPH-dependent 2,4-dienoyl-CoA reductase/sulfur reductase-like enzyme
MVLGDTIGRLIQQWIIQKYGKKITFIPCDALKQIYGNKNKEVTSVLTLKKRKINCDLVVFAMGGAPSTDYILPYRRRKEDEGFKFPHAPALGMNSAREIPVNEVFRFCCNNQFSCFCMHLLSFLQYMETHLINHYACGDVARFPCVAAVSSEAQAGHWGIAQKMGRTAALKMLGKNLSIYDTVPFFWTSVAGITVRYVGKYSC